jgi:hypothetical protein
MNSKKIVAIAIGLLFTLTVFGQDSAQDAKEEAGVSAEAWLMLLDQGDYAESWESSASLAKNIVGKEQWIQSMKSARTIFGNLVKRTIKSTEYATTLPGAPDGHYVIKQYQASFEKKSSAIETVTTMLDSDGKWRVSGYIIN